MSETTTSPDWDAIVATKTERTSEQGIVHYSIHIDFPDGNRAGFTGARARQAWWAIIGWADDAGFALAGTRGQLSAAGALAAQLSANDGGTYRVVAVEPAGRES